MLKTVNGGKLPTRGTKFSAGVDVYSNEDVIIGAGETAIVPLGISIDIDFIMYEIGKVSADCGGIVTDNGSSLKIDAFLKSHFISLKPRSSLRAKGLISHSAVIDMDYKDEIKMIIHNPITSENFDDKVKDGNDAFINTYYTIKKGDKIGQLLLMEHKGYLFGIESEEERSGGFGSTGK